MTYSLKRIAVVALAVSLAVLFGSGLSHAQLATDYYWIGTDGYWSDGSNWNPLGPPPASWDPGGPQTNVYVTQSDATDRTVNLNSAVVLYGTAIGVGSTGTGTVGAT